MAVVLIVDDDPGVVSLVKVTLGLAGHQVVATSELARVVPLAIAARARAVVLDLVLPGFSGFDAFRALRADARTTALPVLMLTGLSAPQDRLRGLTAGAHDYLVKPFLPLELVARMERLLHHAPRGVASPESELSGQLANVDARLAAGDMVAGLLVGRYEVTGFLGRGGMGAVLRAWDPRLQRPVALKLLRADPGSREEASERVHRLLLEAIMVAQVSHPNVVAVYDVGETPSGGFVAMELVEGSTLERHLEAGGRLTPASAVPLAAALFRGLEAAHRRGVVHHDVKPANVLVGADGTVKLADFGVAELSSWSAGKETFHGTPGYVPPEAIQGEPFDERGDIFAAGVVLYQCLAGRPPFSGRTVNDTLVRTLHGEVPSLGARVEAIPELERLVRALLERDPSRRIASAAEAAERLELMALRQGWRWTALPERVQA